MEDRYVCLQRFFTACDELVTGSYLNAEQKITEALKAIAMSRDLVELFTAATEGYDFPTAKRTLLRPVQGGTKLVARIPADRHEVLAYVFCLLVELDAGQMRLNDFLLRYFYVDGSYTASYSIFADRVIRPFRDIVRDCFPDMGQSGRMAALHQKREEIFGEISEKLLQERARIASLALLKAVSSEGDAILDAAGKAAERRESGELTALLMGYRYFLRYIQGECAESEKLFSLIEGL